MDAQGKLWRYRRGISGKPPAKHVSPKATAYEEDLYTAQAVLPYYPERGPDTIETRGLSPIDNEAAPAVSTIVQRGPDQLSDEQRTAFARFLISLWERDPRRLREREASALPAVQDLKRQILTSRNTAESRRRWEDVLDDMDLQAACRNTLREHMVREIEDPRVIDFLKRLAWKLVPVKDMELITADAPLVKSFGDSDAPFYRLTVTLGPNELLLLHEPNSDVDQELPSKMAEAHTLCLIKGNAQYLYSRVPIADGPILKTRSDVEAYFRTDQQ